MLRTRQTRLRKKETYSAANRRWFRPSLACLEDRTVPAAVFQQGVGGYSGTQDTVLFSGGPSNNYGEEVTISVDNQDGDHVRQGLLRFDNVFGPGGSQVPIGSTIISATLKVSVNSGTNQGAVLGFNRMILPWNGASATFNSFQPLGGVQTNGVEAEVVPDFVLTDVSTGIKNLDVTASLKAWASGVPNNGWLISQFGSNGWDFETANAAGNRPELTVDFTPPSGAGSFAFSKPNYSAIEGDAGSSVVTVFVSRSGGVTGTVGVDYTIAPGTASAGADYDNTVTTGKLTFGPNEIIKPITVTIFGDAAIEGTETIDLSLSMPTGGASIGSSTATFTIADQDVLLNEILANVSGAADDGYEYIELIGTPGASLSGINLVAFEGRTEENQGLANIVIDLTGQTIGSNGLFVVRPTTFKYSVPIGTNTLVATELNASGGGIKDRSQTFALIKTPTNLVVGADYDASTVTLNDGILDALPIGADLLDSIGWCEGGSDSDRVLTLTQPGQRISQAQGNEGNLAADAGSRRVGDRAPNNFGSWYGGEIANAVTPIYSLPPFANVSLPAGAQLTPGAANLPRAIEFAATGVTVNETAGTVTIIVSRLGDTSVAASVDYATADGSAKAGVGLDYTAKNGTLNFGIGDDSAPIVININNDVAPEGFETFVMNLTNPSSPFLLSNTSSTVTINDNDAQVFTYQDGSFVGDYTGTQDVGLVGWLTALDKTDSDVAISVDNSDSQFDTDPARPTQAMIRFDDLFGAGPNQIPTGSTIYGAFISFFVSDASDPNTEIRMFRMLQDWNAPLSTWQTPGVGLADGITPDDVEARSTPDAVVSNPGDFEQVNVTMAVDAIQSWANGTAPNYGWVMVSDSSNGWDFESSEAFTAANRPKLTLIYTAPTGAGTFRTAEPAVSINENGTAATITVQRVGANSGSQTINWSITGGTATGLDYTGPTSGSLFFGPTDQSKSFTLSIINDADLESNETVQFTITGVGATITRDTTTLSIRDNDFNAASPAILLNEFLSNPPGNDAPFEFVEFFGTANVGLGSLYFISMGGDNDAFAGNSDVVADLSSFSNGTNGFTVVKATTGGHALPAGTTIVGSSLFDTTNTKTNRTLQDQSNSFLLIYNPNGAFAQSFDYDWNNDGTLDLPAGAVIVDATGWTDGGVGDIVYGGVNISQSYTPDAASRIVGNTTPLSAAAWFLGQIDGNPDSLIYDNVDNTGLPATGATLTPGRTNVSAVSPLAVLSNVKIDNDTLQRSMVRSLTLVFDQQIDHVGSDAIRLTDQGNAFITGVTLAVAGVGTNTLTITFTGAPVIGNSLADGLYRLRVNGKFLVSNGRSVDANNTGFPSSVRTTDFHRLFGDSDGNTLIDLLDFAAFRAAFNPVNNLAFDFDGSNTVDLLDFAAFRDNFGADI